MWHEFYDKALNDLNTTDISESAKKEKAKKIADKQTKNLILKKQITNLFF